LDESLVVELIERDWPPFEKLCRRLALGSPARQGTRVDLGVELLGSDETFRAVLFCDGYDAQPPLLDFADAESGEVGREHWPRVPNAPMNSVEYEGRYVPIVCVPGNRGYHLHQSHAAEDHRRDTWRLPQLATLIWRLFHAWGAIEGRGV
jgi:hypothetical protein